MVSEALSPLPLAFPVRFSQKRCLLSFNLCEASARSVSSSSSSGSSLATLIALPLQSSACGGGVEFYDCSIWVTVGLEWAANQTIF